MLDGIAHKTLTAELPCRPFLTRRSAISRFAARFTAPATVKMERHRKTCSPVSLAGDGDEIACEPYR